MRTLGKLRIDEKAYDVARIGVNKNGWREVHIKNNKGSVVACHTLPASWVDDPIGYSIYVSGHRYSTFFG